MPAPKTVIFVGGTEFSGSTFFHMILANDPHGLAVGEAHNYMRPSRPYHFDMHCSCGEHPCDLWQKLKAAGEERLYANLFEHFPDIQFIVDSSKNPFWIQDQKANLRRQDIVAEDIVIWKTPYEFAKSYKKRGSMASWERSWTVYHRLYYTLFEQWPAVPYFDLANDRTALTAVCEQLGVADFAGKERYWERDRHHVVGGNPSARVHLYTVDNANFKENVGRSSSKIEAANDGTHRSIYYEPDLAPDIKQHVDHALRTNPEIPAVYDLLRERDVRGAGTGLSLEETVLRVPSPYVKMRRAKYWLVRRYAAMRHQLNGG